jgi:hypothetical protein
MAVMSSWSDFEAAAPELARAARGYLDAHVHKTLATLRSDGSPRISGTECIFAEGELWIGSMELAVKARDLIRDGRFALHSGSDDPPGWKGDAKVAGRAVEVTDPEVLARVVGDGRPPGPMHLFRADVTEVAVVELGDPADHIVIRSWHPGRGVEERKRT